MLDLAHLTDAQIYSEAAKRRARNPGTGRPRVLKPCPKCGGQFGVMDLRKHIPRCSIDTPTPLP